MKGRLKNFAEKLKTVKHIELILLAAAVCIALLIYLGVNESKESKLPVYSVQQPQSSEEARLEALLESVTGVGDCSVMITYGEDGRAEGVVVTAEVAGDTNVKRKIIDIICTLMDVDGGKIKIYKKN